MSCRACRVRRTGTGSFSPRRSSSRFYQCFHDIIPVAAFAPKTFSCFSACSSRLQNGHQPPRQYHRPARQGAVEIDVLAGGIRQGEIRCRVTRVDGIGGYIRGLQCCKALSDRLFLIVRQAADEILHGCINARGERVCSVVHGVVSRALSMRRCRVSCRPFMTSTWLSGRSNQGGGACPSRPVGDRR